MAKIDRVQEINLDLLRPYQNNAKIHSEEQVNMIADSIKEFGFISPCLIDSDYNIIAGHGRVMAAKQIGMDKVPCLFIEGLTEAQRKAYILADNKLTEMGEWDEDLVADELMSLKEAGFNIDLTGFNVDDIIFADEEDVYQEPEEETQDQNETPRIKKNEIWQLGNHLLMCGDSTNIEDVEKLMEGELADLVEIDPPYNVDVHNSLGETIENDNLPEDEFYEFLLKVFGNFEQFLKAGGSFYVWHADTNGGQFRNALEENGLKIRQNIIWVKSHFTITRQDYQWRHEPCLYGWKEGAAHYFIDLRTQTTVEEYSTLEKLDKDELLKVLNSYLDDISTVMHEKVSVNDLHPTMKPLSLIKKQIRNSSRENEIVLDLFGGSGTTLIACEELNRKCRMMEYDPKYAERIIKRWEEATGQKAVLRNG